MAVEVYYWEPKGGSVGHAAIKVNGGTPPGEEYFSLWPGSEWSIWLAGSGGFKTYEFDYEDHKKDGSYPQVVRLTKLDETAIKARIKTLKGIGVYSLSVANCASQTGLCLRAGVPLLVPYPFPNSPWAVYWYARSLMFSFA